MHLDYLLEMIDQKLPPAPREKVLHFERVIGAPLPDDYREFLIRCNGGFLGGSVCFAGPTPDGQPGDACINHVGGFRQEAHFSLGYLRSIYQEGEDRIPEELIWIMDDPFGNAICLGVKGEHRGRVYFWDHENEPDPEQWDGRVETSGNIELLANTFTDFVAGLASRCELE